MIDIPGTKEVPARVSHRLPNEMDRLTPWSRTQELRVYYDDYKERIVVQIKSKMKGEVAHVKEERPKKQVAKSMMEALRATAESLKLPKTS